MTTTYIEGFNGLFPGNIELTDCPFDFHSPLVCTSSRDR